MPKIPRKKKKEKPVISTTWAVALSILAVAIVASILMPVSVDSVEGADSSATGGTPSMRNLEGTESPSFNDGGNPQLQKGDQAHFDALPRENRCETCKFLVDHSRLAIERHIKAEKDRQLGAESRKWGQLKMRMNPRPVLRAMCTDSSLQILFDHYVGPFDRTWSEHSPHGNTTAADTLAACRILVNTAAVLDKLVDVYMAPDAIGMPLSYLGEQMPDRKIPKGNLKMKTEADYAGICVSAWNVCNTSEVEPRIVVNGGNGGGKAGAAGATMAKQAKELDDKMTAQRHAEADAELQKQLNNVKGEMAKEMADNQAKENESV